MRKHYPFVVPLIGMVAVLRVAYGLDNWIDALTKAARMDFAGTAYLWPSLGSHLLLASLILTLLWFVHHRGDKGRLLALIYTGVGLGLLFYNPVIIALAPGVRFPMLLSLVPKSLSALTSAIIAAFGLQRLVVRQAPP